MLQDLRVAMRGLARAPGLTFAAVTTLALGIGATSLTFGVLEALVLRPLPFGERTPRLVSLHSTHPTQARDWDDSGLSWLDLRDVRTEARTLAAAEGVLERNFSLAADGVAERVTGASVTPRLFALLGVRPQLGRSFRADEAAEPGHEPVALLSDPLWARRFGRDREVLGRTITVNGRGVTVIGIMPPGFRFPTGHDIWLPYAPPPEPERDNRAFLAIGLLAEGTSMKAAQAELDAIATRLASRYPGTNRGWGIHALALHDLFVQSGTSRSLVAMLGAVSLVLLVACANVAGLLLARGIGRQQELAVRAALGAGRARLVRLLLVESLLLAAAGSGIGLVLARWGLDAMIASNPEPPPYWARFELGGTGMLVIVALCLLSTLACGLLPALRTVGGARGRLSSGARGSAGGDQRRAQSALVAAQIAASLALLVGATLLMRSAMAMDRTSAGFERGPLLSLRVYLAGDAYDTPAARSRALSRLEARFAALPGVAAAAATGAIPADDGGDTVRLIADRGTTTQGEETGVETIPAAPGLWDALGISLLAGRSFTTAENEDEDADVAIVNQRLAAAFFPSGDAVGRRVGVVEGDGTRWLRVIGVAPNVVYEEVGEETSQSRLNLFVPCAVTGWRTMAMIVRAERDPSPFAALAPRLVSAAAPGAAAFDVMTMEQRLTFTNWGERFLGRMFGGFALASLLLACIGTYGLVSYAAAQRRRELGVRTAVGATAADLLRLLLGGGARLAVGGLLLGLPLALAAARLVEGLLFGVTAWDFGVWATLPAALLAAVLLASYVPARRASRVDPASALRQE